MKPGDADRDPKLKEWLDAPEQSYNRFKDAEKARAYAEARAKEQARGRR